MVRMVERTPNINNAVHIIPLCRCLVYYKFDDSAKANILQVLCKSSVIIVGF